MVTVAVDKSGRFKIVAPMSVFEKADAPVGQRRRIGGIVSTDSWDREGERILQEGLNFQPFLHGGWFNDNHKSQTGKGVGFPTGVRLFRAGDILPNGQRAASNCHWAEGYLLDGHPPADEIWTMAQALNRAGEGHRLGFSIEGMIRARDSNNERIILSADIMEVAVTRCPINTDTKVELLSRALGKVRDGLAKSSMRPVFLGDPHVRAAGADMPPGEPDGDEAAAMSKVHQQMNPDAPIDSYQEQIEALLSELSGIVSSARIAFEAHDVFSQALDVEKEYVASLEAGPVPGEHQTFSSVEGAVMGKASSTGDNGGIARRQENNMSENKGAGVSVEALAKSISELRELFAQTPAGRKQALLQKAQTGLTQEEQAELVGLLSGKSQMTQEVASAVRAEPVSKAVSQDATGFLKGIASGVETATSKLAEVIEKSERASQDRQAAIANSFAMLAGVVAEQAGLIKSLQGSVEKLMEQPAEASQARQIPAVLAGPGGPAGSAGREARREGQASPRARDPSGQGHPPRVWCGNRSRCGPHRGYPGADGGERGARHARRCGQGTRRWWRSELNGQEPRKEVEQCCRCKTSASTTASTAGSRRMMLGSFVARWR